MATSWADASEITCGLLLTGKISPNAVREEIFLSPYDEIVKLHKSGKVEIEEIIEQVGLSPVQASLDAVKSLNGLSKSNWISILENTYTLYQAGEKFERISKKLKKGEDIDWSIISNEMKRAQDGLSENLVPMSRVTAKEMPFISCGWKPIDEHLGGIPESGMIVVAGLPGIGKSSLSARLAVEFAKKYPEKKIAIFSFEMILEELKMRFNEIEKIPEKIQERILLCEKVFSASEVISTAASSLEVGKGMVIADFADYMVQGEVTEAKMAEIYMTLSVGAKRLKIPIFLVAQLNRQGGALPKPNDIRYTGMAENLSYMIWMLYNPATSWKNTPDDKSAEALPILDKVAYIVVWKVRGGFRQHLDDWPGAIAIPFTGKKGWHPTQSRWFSLRRYA